MMKKLTLLALILGFFASCIETKVDDGTTVTSGKKITEFKIGDQIGDITDATREIDFILPFGTDVTALSPVIKFSDKATITPASGASVDFTNPVVYTVRAENGSTAEYTVTVGLMPLQITNVTPETVSELAATTVSLMGNFGTSGNVVQLFKADLAQLGTDITPETQSDVLITFKTPATIPSGVYTVKVKNGATVVAATQTITAQSSAADMLTFADGANNYTLAVDAFSFVYPIGTDLTAITPTITLSPGATVNPASGAVQNLSSAVTYTVTASNGTTIKTYTALATKGAMAISAVTPATVGTDAVKTITVDGTFAASGNTVEVVKALDATASTITPTITSQSATQIVFTIPAASALGDYKVKVKNGVDELVSAAQFAVKSSDVSITSVTIDGSVVTPVGDAYTVVLPITSTVDYAALSPAIVLGGLANGATVSPAVAQNFATAPSNTITYTVTAGDGTTKPYTVKVTQTAMAITAVAPALFGNGATQEITVDGTFAASGNTFSISKDSWDTSINGTSTAQSATQLKFTIPAGSATGTYKVQVVYGTKSVTSTQTFDVVSSAKVISAAAIETNPATIDQGLHTIVYNMPYVNANRSFTPDFTISNGASVTPTGDQDFTSPVAYTVTAADATTQDYNFIINFPSLAISSADVVGQTLTINGAGTLPKDATGVLVGVYSDVSLGTEVGVDQTPSLVTAGSVFSLDVSGLTLTPDHDFWIKLTYGGNSTSLIFHTPL